VTYNFEPERWYEMHAAAIRARLQRGELSEESYLLEIRELDRRYDELLDRLDGSFQIPESPADRSP